MPFSIFVSSVSRGRGGGPPITLPVSLEQAMVARAVKDPVLLVESVTAGEMSTVAIVHCESQAVLGIDPHAAEPPGLDPGITHRLSTIEPGGDASLDLVHFAERDPRLGPPVPSRGHSGLRFQPPRSEKDLETTGGCDSFFLNSLLRGW